MTRTLLCAALLSVVPSLHAQSWQDQPDAEDAARMQQQAEAMEAYQARIAVAMASSADARERAFAELLRRPSTSAGQMPSGDAPSRALPADAATETRLRAIAQRAGNDRLANQLLVAAISDPASTIRSEAARRWQASDPGNLIPLLSAGLATDTILIEARRATAASAHMYEVIRWMASVYRRHPLNAAEVAALSAGDVYHADEGAALAAMALWSATAMPSHRGLIDACRGNALRATPTRTADCRHVATVLAAHSDSVLDRMVGLSMQRELADGNAERTVIDAQRRTMDWQMMQWGRIAQQQPRDGAEQFVRLLRDDSIQTERQLAERVLQEAGVPLEPPAGWSPPRY